MMTTLQKVENLKNNNFRFDLGDLISDILNNYKKIWGLQGLIMLVLALLLTITFGSIGALAFSLGDMTAFFTDYDPNNISSVGLIIKMSVTIIFAGLVAPINAGLINICHLAQTNKTFSFSSVFDFYKSKYVSEIIISTVIIATVSQGIQTLSDLYRINIGELILPFYFIIPLFIILITIPLLTFLTIPFIIFGELNAIDAIKSSITISLKKFWIILLIALLVSVGIFMGIFALCIGIFFTIPIWFSMHYIIYKNSVGIDDVNELDQLGSYK